MATPWSRISSRAYQVQVVLDQLALLGVGELRLGQRLDVFLVVAARRLHLLVGLGDLRAGSRRFRDRRST